jgi:transcriptional regulator with PAS, ATPase and Fis domain
MMMQNRPSHTVPCESAEDLTRAQQEKETLAQQVKQLIKSESKLYEFQEKLDAQLKEYKNLNELSRKLTATFELGKIFEYALEYIIYSLQYERALILQADGAEAPLLVRALDGYYSEKEKRGIEPLALAPGAGLLSRLRAGTEYLLCTAGTEEKLFHEYRAKLQMDEYVIYPLGSHTMPLALLIVGNSGENAAFHRRVTDREDSLLGLGNLTGLLSSSLENHTFYTGMEKALQQERRAEEAVRALNAELEKKNDELALVNKRLTNFFNTVSDGVMIVDREERVIELNPAARGMLGKKAQTVLGITFGTLVDQRTSPKSGLQPTREAFSDVEIMVDSPDGACHCLASGEPILNELGEVTGGLVILRPIQQVQNLVHRFSGYFATLQFSDVIGESEGIREAVRLAKLTATTSSNVLLEGESGTGKEIFAQAIHNRSNQHNGPFIALNCGAIPRELIASELFGYEEGAFTGAKRGGKPGKFELASGGTLFLDEIGDMPLEQQSSLLRVIQEKKVARIGSDKMIAVNVRLICASNKNLLKEVERGAFRHDLFYRLNVMSITIPPLRERRSDIPLLFNHFLEKIGRDRGTKFPVNMDVYDCLVEYAWPGNVRELQNVVERAASLAENGVVSLRQLPVELYSPLSYAEPRAHVPEAPPEPTRPRTREQRQKTVRESEKARIIELLNRHGGNVSKVAREMGVSRKTMYNKMRLFGIEN